MLGQDKNIELIYKWRRNKSIPRFIIIEGGRNSGKLTLAKLIMKSMKAQGIIIDTGVQDIRDMIDNAYNVTATTFYIIKNIENMRNEAKNAMLKVVEEPPNNAYFIATTSDSTKTLDTINSRATTIKMQQYTRKDLASYSNTDLQKEICSTPALLEKYLPEEIDRADEFVSYLVKNIKGMKCYDFLRVLKENVKQKSTETNKIPEELLMLTINKHLYQFALLSNNTDTIKNIVQLHNNVNSKVISNRFAIEMYLMNVYNDINGVFNND